MFHMCEITLFYLFFLIISSIATASDDGGIVEDCSENVMSFGCKENTVVIITEAWLHDAMLRMPKYKCHIPEYNVQFKRGSVLQHINKRCAKQQTCQFNVLEDVPGVKKEEDKWRGHVVRVNYQCVKDENTYHTCGERIEAQTGWLRNAGYPKYYLGPGACTFTVIVDQGQKVNLKIVDLSTREIVRPAETECNDYISVTEGNQQLYSSCGDLNKPISVVSHENVLNVTLHSSVNVYTKRGFVAYFKAMGCPTPAVPEDGYLSHRNSSHAEFWCCVRHVFPDTMQRVRTLACKYQLSWDQELPDCVDLEDLLQAGNITEEEYRRYNSSGATAMPLTDKEVIYDIVLPGVIMTVLIIGNVGVLFLIVMCRRRILPDNENPEELESIKANAEPTDFTETVPSQV